MIQHCHRCHAEHPLSSEPFCSSCGADVAREQREAYRISQLIPQEIPTADAAEVALGIARVTS